MAKLIPLMVCVILAACVSSEPPAASPEDQAEALVRAIEAGQCDEVKRIVLTPSEVRCAAIEQSEGSFAQSDIDLDGAEYVSSAPIDHSAVVTATWNDELPSEVFDVQRVGGVWKVVFDSNV